MQWSEVRDVYPGRFVLMEMLQSHEQDNVLFVDEVAIIRPLDDPKEVMQELGNTAGIDSFIILPKSRLLCKFAGMPDCEGDGVKVEHQDGLLLANMEITFRGRSMTLSRLVIDTGAECTLISPDDVAELNVLPEDTPMRL